MRYQYNAELCCDHVTGQNRIASCLDRQGNGVLLIADEDRGHDVAVVANFQERYCTNAQTFPISERHKYWNLFDEIRRDYTDPARVRQTMQQIILNRLRRLGPLALKSAPTQKAEDLLDVPSDRP